MYDPAGEAIGWASISVPVQVPSFSPDLGASMTSDASPRSAAPLNAFQHLKTTNLAVLEASVRRFFPGARFEISNSVTKLDAVANRRRRDTENLRRLFMFLVDRLDSATSSFHPLALAELEQAVI